MGGRGASAALFPSDSPLRSSTDHRATQGATELYEYGWGDSFHFCRYYPGEPFYQAIARHEHYLAHQTGIKPKMRVLDVGCGVGGPAREIARFTDAEGAFFLPFLLLIPRFASTKMLIRCIYSCRS
jgi:SAM-dependent methyltransferase